jgi:hypothetical protein
VVALAREVATTGLKGSGHAVVDIAAGVRVLFGLERGGGDHLHVCLGQTSQTEADGEGVEMHFVDLMGISKRKGKFCLLFLTRLCC